MRELEFVSDKHVGMGWASKMTQNSWKKREVFWRRVYVNLVIVTVWEVWTGWWWNTGRVLSLVPARQWCYLCYRTSGTQCIIAVWIIWASTWIHSSWVPANAWKYCKLYLNSWVDALSWKLTYRRQHHWCRSSMDHALLVRPIRSMMELRSIVAVERSIVVEEHSIAVVERSIVVELHSIVVVVQVDSMLLVQCRAIKHYRRLESLDTMLDWRQLGNEQVVRVVVRLMSLPQRQ